MSKTNKSDTASPKQETTGAAINGGAGAENAAEAATKLDTSSPQPPTTGAATNGGAGAEPKPKAATKAKALYLVGACPVLHDHEVFQPGDELELTEAEAARLGSKVTAVKA